mmetsp:Transcript_58076/g.127393  ORF Transcript_58076/g.127393 Transcript_58076/m.127393 type:complete len:102 (+) Transcript_58076:2608-2913(+)
MHDPMTNEERRMLQHRVMLATGNSISPSLPPSLHPVPHSCTYSTPCLSSTPHDPFFCVLREVTACYFGRIGSTVLAAAANSSSNSGDVQRQQATKKTAAAS